MSRGTTRIGSGPTRRDVVIGAGAAAMTIGMPAILKAQPASLKVGILHPVTGGLAYEGEQCRKGALLGLHPCNYSFDLRCIEC